MKNKYQRLSRQEKKQVAQDFRAASEKNNNYMGVLNRMLILGIIGLVYGIASIFGDIFFFKASVLAYIIDAIVIIFSVFLIVQHYRIKGAVLNYFLIDPKLKVLEDEVQTSDVELEESEPKEVVFEEKKPAKKTTKKSTGKKTNNTTKKTSTTKKSTTTKKAASTKKTATKKTTKKSVK